MRRCDVSLCRDTRAAKRIDAMDSTWTIDSKTRASGASDSRFVTQAGAHQMRKSLTLIAAAVKVATSATAAERSGFYIGGDVGQSNWNVTQKDANDFAAAIAGELGIFYDTITPDKGKLSDTDTTYSLFVGYQFVPWLAVEASWMDLGNETIKASGRYDYPSPHP